MLLLMVIVFELVAAWRAASVLMLQTIKKGLVRLNYTLDAIFGHRMLHMSLDGRVYRDGF